MSKFNVASLYGGAVEFISSYDPAIDWDKSEIEKEEYAKNPVENSSKIALKEGEAPIRIFLHHPSEEELMTAFQLGDLDIDPESGATYRGDTYAPGVGAIVGLSLAQRSLSTLCIDRVENLDDWPKDAKAKNSYGLEELTSEAIDAFGPQPIQRAVLKQVGRYLMEAVNPSGN